MLILWAAVILAALAAGVAYAGRNAPLDRNELLALQRYSDKIHREEALPFNY